MKIRYLFFCFLAILTVSFMNSCRKQTPNPLGENDVLQDSPTHCFNGMLDEDETGYDCGGSCPACAGVTAPCTTTINIVNANSIPTSYSTACLVISDDDVVKGTASGKYIEFTFPFPIVSGNFNVETGVAFFDEVGVNYHTNGFNHFGIGTGEVYVNTNGTQVSIDFCDVVVSGIEGFSTVSYTLVGNLTCN